jgi:hypothetical protein
MKIAESLLIILLVFDILTETPGFFQHGVSGLGAKKIPQTPGTPGLFGVVRIE